MPQADQLEDALDSQRQAAAPFLGRYTLLGAAGRRVGGQGLVQFALQPETSLRVAIKVRCARVSQLAIKVPAI